MAKKNRSDKPQGVIISKGPVEPVDPAMVAEVTDEIESTKAGEKKKFFKKEDERHRQMLIAQSQELAKKKRWVRVVRQNISPELQDDPIFVSANGYSRLFLPNQRVELTEAQISAWR